MLVCLFGQHVCHPSPIARHQLFRNSNSTALVRAPLWHSATDAPCIATHVRALFAAQRLVSHAEEIAFNDPPGGPAEQLILNQHLRRMLKYSRMSAFQRFIQQVCVCVCVLRAGLVVGVAWRYDTFDLSACLGACGCSLHTWLVLCACVALCNGRVACTRTGSHRSARLWSPARVSDA